MAMNEITDIRPSIKTDFPQIWIAEGSVDCNEPLIPDPCTTETVSYEYSWTTVTDNYEDEPIPSMSLVAKPILVLVQASTRQYEPTIYPTKFTSTVHAPSLLARSPRPTNPPTILHNSENSIP